MSLRHRNTLNQLLVQEVKKIVVLKPYREVPDSSKIRIKRKDFQISEEVGRISDAALTVHDLEQYKNKIYSYHFEEAGVFWIDKLLEVSRE